MAIFGIMNIRLTREQKIKILNSKDLYKIMQQVLLREKKIDRNKEHFWVVCLAANQRLIMIELVSLGTVNKTIAEPMEVFSFALQKRAAKIILVHNHTSDDVAPSEDDYEITEQMWAIGKFLKCPVIDHLIITEEEYLSFEDYGLLDKIKKANRYDLTFAKVDLLLLQMKELEKKQNREMVKAKKEIAMSLLSSGQSVEEVMKHTGLTKKQVEGLSK